MKPFYVTGSESGGKFQRAFLAGLIKYTSFDGKSGKFFMLSALVLSHLQILFQSVYLVFQCISNDRNDLSATTQIIERIFNFDDIFSYGYDDSILLLTCCGILVYFILLLASFSIVVYSARTSKKPNYMVAQILPTLLQIHALVLFWPIQNLVNRLQIESKVNNLSEIYLNLGHNTILAISIIVSVVNIASAAIPSFLLYHILATKSPLASRNYYLDQLSFLQKLIISFAIKSDSLVSEAPWILLVVETLFSLIRQAWYIYALPRYSIITFKLELYLINITTMLPILTIIIFIINKNINDPLTTATLIIVFIVLCVMVIILTMGTLKKMLLDILFKSVKSLGPKKALYKLTLVKYLVVTASRLNINKPRFDTLYFYFSTANNCTSQLFEEYNFSQRQLNLDMKEDRNQLKRQYLEFLVSHFEKQDEFKLMLAEIYAKNLNLYTLAIKLVTRIKYSFSSFHVKVSADLLYMKIQEYIMKNEQKRETKINLSEFISIKKEQESLQSEITKQLDLHTKFWQQYSNNHTELSELQRLSHMIDKQKLSINHQWSGIENRHSKNLAYLCLLYGRYQIVLNPSFEKGLKYIRKHKLLSRPSDPTLPLNSSNFLDNNNFSVAITTRQENLGNIIRSSESIQKALGYQKSFLVGSSVGVLMSPYISERHNAFISEYIKTGKRTFMGEPQSVFIKDASGNLRKASVFANLHPSLNEEVCLIGLFRLLEDPLEYMLLSPNGEIDLYSEGIGIKLDLQRKHAHIENICRDYEEVMGPRETKIDQYREENFQNEMKEHQDEKGGVSLLLKEEVLSPSSPLFASRKTSVCTPSLPKNLVLSQDAEKVSLRQKKKAFSNEHIYKRLRISFNTYSLFPDKLTQTFSYDCTVDTMSFQNGYLRVLAIEMNNKTIEEQTGAKNTSSFGERLEINKNNSFFPQKKILQPNRIQGLMPQDLPDQIMSSSRSTSSVSPGRKHTSTYIENALDHKYYPKQTSHFLVAIVILVCVNLSIEGLFHQNTEAAMEKIKALTTTMDLANSRADAFTMLARSTRATYYVRESYLPAGLAATNGTIAGLWTVFVTYLPILASSNAQLESAIQDVSTSFRDIFTAENIRIYDFNPDLTLGPYRNFSTFMAIDELIQQISSLKMTYATTFPLYQFHTIFQNSVNDLLESTVQAVDVIYNEIQTSSDNIQSTLRIYQILTMCFIVFRILISCWIFYWAYISDKDLGQKFLSILPQQVEMIQQKLHNFRKNLEKEDVEQLNLLKSKIPLL